MVLPIVSAVQWCFTIGNSENLKRKSSEAKGRKSGSLEGTLPDEVVDCSGMVETSRVSVLRRPHN
jgi:hypothetical protein